MKIILVYILISILMACQNESTVAGTQTNDPEPSKVTACTKDLKMCPDGQGVGRNPDDNCAFYACKTQTDKKSEPLMCTQDVKQCPDGSFVGRDATKNCAFKPCPEGSNLR